MSHGHPGADIMEADADADADADAADAADAGEGLPKRLAVVCAKVSDDDSAVDATASALKRDDAAANGAALVASADCSTN